MPEDGLATDLDHGFWLEIGFFGEAGSEASSQDDHFHDNTIMIYLIIEVRGKVVPEVPTADPDDS